MPIFAVLIAPLMGLYIKYRLVQYAVKLMLFLAVYQAFKESMQYIINTIMSKVGVLNMPCMISFIMNELEIFTMINFALSVYGTIYIGKFFYNSIMKLI